LVDRPVTSSYRHSLLGARQYTTFDGVVTVHQIYDGDGNVFAMAMVLLAAASASASAAAAAAATTTTTTSTSNRMCIMRCSKGDKAEEYKY
jgi:hypothetical protein